MNEAIKYLSELLGLDINNHLVLSDINAELSNIAELDKFILFARENFDGQEMAYKNGFQKFLVLVKNYKKQQDRLSFAQLSQINSFSDKLYKKTCDIFDELLWEIEARGRDLNKYDIPAIFKPEELQVLAKVGKRDRLSYLVRHNKPELLEKIKQIVSKLTIQKNNGSTAIEDNKTLKRLKGE